MTEEQQDMSDKTWKVMSDLEDAFNQITTFYFLLNKLQEAVDGNHHQKIIDTTAALNAFYTPYCNNWDEKFMKAWEFVVKKED